MHAVQAAAILYSRCFLPSQQDRESSMDAAAVLENAYPPAMQR